MLTELHLNTACHIERRKQHIGNPNSETTKCAEMYL